ncbi:MAG: helix-turn-helix domain-containing protein [Pirellulales bacterium]
MHANPSGSQSAGMAAAKYAAAEPFPLLLSERDAAKFLGISPRTLWQLRKDGRIPFVAISERCIRYSVDQLRAWAASHADRSAKLIGGLPND